MMDMTSYGPMFWAFSEVMQPAGYHLMFVHVPRTTSGVQPASILQAVDAAVFYHNVTPGEQEAAKLVRGPAILVNCEPRLPYTRVNPDDVAGATALTQHLLELGHKRIAFLERGQSGAEYDHFSRSVRQQTLRQVMTAAGAEFALWQVELATPYAELVARWRRLPAKERPTALVVYYSIEAINVLNEFLRQGVRVPEELSLATFDDHELVAQAMVPLTTVAVPMIEMGRTAAELLLGLLQDTKPKATKAITLPERLVVRQSTGPLPR
jgi:DNA-binding LacI/PurR family transcriptional regulator